MKPQDLLPHSAAPAPRAVLAAALAALFLSLPAAAQERFRRTPPLPDAQRMELKLPTIETFSLPNGLTVATARRPGTRVVTLQLVVRAGEADSPPSRGRHAGWQPSRLLDSSTLPLIDQET